MSMVYVASPYTHPDPLVREIRMLLVEQYVVRKVKNSPGEFYYSPIVYAHALGNRYELPKEVNFWHGFNLPSLMIAERIEILMLPGWKESKGVSWEIDEALELNKEIKYVEPQNSAELLGLA